MLVPTSTANLLILNDGNFEDHPNKDKIAKKN